MGKSSYRATTAYPCAYYSCGRPGVGVETRIVQPNGMAASVGFYGYCIEHEPEGART